MERINELGVNPAYIYNASFDGHTDRRNETTGEEEAVYTEISTESQKATNIDKAKLLELLGPSVTEKYSELITSISEHTSRTQDFIERVNSNIDIYA